MTAKEKTARLALALTAGIGPVRGRWLLDVFGSAETALGASPEKLRQKGGLPKKVASGLKDGLAWAEEETARLDKLGGWVMVYGEESYPDLLAGIDRPPLALFGRGEITPADDKAVAIVGSRHGTEYGRRVTMMMARELARSGVTVVSGLAVGIDTAAHQGALDGGGRTIGVLGCGLDVDYPKPNRRLKEEIVGSGAMITEYPLGTQPKAGTFPARNRIIAGLAKGTVVAEASPRSGSLITAKQALDFGREVMAVPGLVTDRRRAGTHTLIRQGAALVGSGRHVIEELWPEGAESGERVRGPNWEPVEEDRPEIELEPETARVFDQVEGSPRHVDDIIRGSGLPPEEVVGRLLDLELEGLVARQDGQMFVRK